MTFQRTGLGEGVHVAGGGVARVPQKARVPEREEGLRLALAARIPGVLVRAELIRHHAVERKALEVLLELVLLLLGGGVGRGVEVGADVDIVVPEIFYLLHELGLVGEVLAVYGVGHAVFQTAADEVVYPVAVYVRDEGTQLLPNLA